MTIAGSPIEATKACLWREPSAFGGKTIAIVQSNYIPWKGCFDLIGLVDEFVLFDDVQYTKRDWRNRNRIKTANGPQWLTVPVETKGQFHQCIDEVTIADGDWAERHWRSIEFAYRRAPHFDQYRDAVEALYKQAATEPSLSLVNRQFLEGISGVLGITTPLSWSRDYGGEGQKSDRLVAICRAAGATTYLSGPSARTYLSLETFASAGLRLEYMDYTGYPEYTQRHGPFDHYVSVIDLLFNLGENAQKHMKYAQRLRQVERSGASDDN